MNRKFYYVVRVYDSERYVHRETARPGIGGVDYWQLKMKGMGNWFPTRRAAQAWIGRVGTLVTSPVQWGTAEEAVLRKYANGQSK